MFLDPTNSTRAEDVHLADRREIWQLESSTSFSARVEQGRVAVFVCEKANALSLDTLRVNCSPFGVGEVLECKESQYILAVSLVDSSSLMSSGEESEVVASLVDPSSKPGRVSTN